MMEDRAVVTVAIGYPLARWAAFVLTLRAHYDGAIVVFTNRTALGADIIALALAQRVQLAALATEGGCPDHNSTLSVSRAMAGNNFKDHTFAVAIAAKCRQYRWCFSTDFRDVFFQADPFATLPPDLDLEPARLGRYVDGALAGRANRPRRSFQGEYHACRSGLARTLTRLHACLTRADWRMRSESSSRRTST